MTEGAFFWSSAPASPPSPSTSGIHGMDRCIDGHVCGCTSINETVLYTISVVGSENVHTLLWCSIDGVLTIAFLRWGFKNRILVVIMMMGQSKLLTLVNPMTISSLTECIHSF